MKKKICIVLGTIVLIILYIAISNAMSWWDTSWNRCKNINITGGNSMLTNFTALINVTYDSDMNSDFSDVRFINTTCNNGGSELDFEIDNKINSNYAMVWTRIPSLNTSVNQISIYYKNPSAISSENSLGVWANASAIYHFEDSMNDSSLFSNNLTNQTSMPSLVNGKFGKAYHFDANRFLKSVSNVSINGTAKRTLFTWNKPGVYTGTNYDHILCFGLNAATRSFGEVAFDIDGYWYFYGYNADVTSTAKVLLDTWQYLTYVYNGSDISIYFNGQLNVTGHRFELDTGSGNLFVGISCAGLGGYGRNGTLDELQLYNEEKSAEWVLRNYQNYNFSNVVFGKEEEKLLVVLSFPENNSYSSVDKTFECNATDKIQLSNITLYIWNSTNDIVNNTEIKHINGTSNSTQANITFTTTDTYHWNCLAYNNGSDSTFAYSNYTLNVEISNPVIDLNYPNNNSWLNYKNNVYFNYTPEDAQGLDTCQLYGNFTGTWHFNLTDTSITNYSMNYFIQNLSDGYYSWNVFCNDTSNNEDFAKSNRTLYIDTTIPSTRITNTNGTTVESLAITINFNISDTNIDICYFTLRDSTGTIHNYAENTSVTCSDTSRSISTLSYGIYTFTLWAEDKADNLNSSTLTFTTQAPPVSTGGGGGGKEIEVTVVALIKHSNDTTIYSKIGRAKIYKALYDYCPQIITKICLLNEQQLTELQSILKRSYELDLTIEKLLLWLEQYNNNQIENIDVLKKEADTWNLIKAEVVVVPTEFAVTPSRLDPFFTFIFFKSYYEWSVKSNKVLKSASIVSGDPEISVKLAGNTTAIVILNITNLDWNAKSFRAVANYVDINGNSLFQNINLRVINIHPIWRWLVLIVFILLIILLLKFRKRLIRLIKLKRKND